MNEQDIVYIFWTNVDWHRKNKKLYWTDLVGGNTLTAKRKTANVTLNRVQEIAIILEIDDYAILFEELVEQEG